jgi:hypothetical protein
MSVFAAADFFNVPLIDQNSNREMFRGGHKLKSRGDWLFPNSLISMA